MMRMMNNKANVKIFSIVIATVFIIGIGALAYTQMATPSGNGGASTIGVIDTSRMMSQDNPLFVSAAQEFMSYQSQLQQETQAKIDAAQDDATKQKLVEEMRQNLAKKDQEIAKSIQDKAMEAAKAVGDGKGLSVVMSKDTVLYGGVDITDQVLKKLASDAKKISCKFYVRENDNGREKTIYRISHISRCCNKCYGLGLWVCNKSPTGAKWGIHRCCAY